jgi:hypothetical protein
MPLWPISAKKVKRLGHVPLPQVPWCVEPLTFDVVIRSAAWRSARIQSYSTMLGALQVYSASLEVHCLFLHLVIFDLSQTYVRGTVGMNISSSQSE